MISLKSLKKSCRVSSPEAVVALFFCGLIGLSMVVLVPENAVSKLYLGVVEEAPASLVTPEEHSESMASLEQKDLDKLIKFCIAHTTASRGFVIYRNGSCALIKEPSENPIKEARAILKDCAETDARFIAERTAEGDLIVTFKGSVFHWISGDDIEGIDQWTLGNIDILLSEKEREAAAPGWEPPVDARIGLVARKRLMDDATSGEVVKILRPNTSIAQIR